MSALRSRSRFCQWLLPSMSERVTVRVETRTIGGNMTDIRRRSREEIIASLSRGSPREIQDALISACYWDKDWKWALQQLRKICRALRRPGALGRCHRGGLYRR